MADTKTKIIAKTIGRRKNAIASVRLMSGSGEVTVNGKDIGQYFPGLWAKLRYEQPFKVTAQDKKYDASIKVHGGGSAGQLDAATLGLARALAGLKDDFRVLLRKANLLTRDPRERQRRMVGTGGKARRTKQSPKR